MKLIFYACLFKLCGCALAVSNAPLNWLDAHLWLPNKHNTGLGGQIGLHLVNWVVCSGAKVIEAAKQSGLEAL